MSDYRSNKTNAEIDAILDNATPKGTAGDAPDILSLQGARTYSEVLSRASLICAGEIIAPHTILGSITIGAEVEVTDAFRLKFGENNPAVTKVVLVDKRVVDGEEDNMDTRYIYSGDYEGCYFVMGDFDGNDTIFGLDATEGDWIIAQNKQWTKIVTKQREIAGIEGEVTAEALAQKLSTPTQELPNPLVTTTQLNNKVDKVEGKGLSSEDFTSTEKRKLAGLENYDDADLREDLENLQNNVGNVMDLVNDFNDDIANLYKTKQDTIENLDLIRNGAYKGATAVQKIVINNTVISPDVKTGVADLGNIEGGGGNVSFIDNDSLQDLPFGYIGGYYRSYEFDGVSSEEVNLGYINNYYYDTIAIAYDDVLFEERISELMGDGKIFRTVVVRVDDSYNLYAKQIVPKKTTFGWRIYTNKQLMPDSWVNLENYYTKSEVDSAIATAITTTLNTPV